MNQQRKTEYGKLTEIELQQQYNQISKPEDLVEDGDVATGHNDALAEEEDTYDLRSRNSTNLNDNL